MAIQRTSRMRRVKAFQPRLNLTDLSGISNFAFLYLTTGVPDRKRPLYWGLPKGTLLICLALALLCVLTYAPSLSLPLLEDDYANIWGAQHYGSWAGFPAMFHDDVARVRATVYWTIYLVWKYFGLSPLAFRVSNLILQIFDTWLLYAIGLAWGRMRPAAFWAAAFFAVYEGHQEAVMWFSANNELLLFLFGGASLLCWIKASSRPANEWLLRAAGLLLFVLALLSKESAYIFVPLFLLATPVEEWRRSLPHLAPYCLLAAVMIVSVVLTRGHSFRFTDGSFSLHAPVWLTLPRNVGRVLWFWGLLSVTLIFMSSAAASVRKSALIALAWIAIALVPYSFLTYSTQIPSRQLYLASVGLSFLFGLAMVQLREITLASPQRAGRGPEFPKGTAPPVAATQAPFCAPFLKRSWLAAIVMLAVVGHNVGYIWIKKQRQFRERAEPTQELIQAARQTDGLLWVQCFPRHPSIAEAAVWVALNRYPSNLIFTPDQAAPLKPSATFCYKGH
ncbi:MAG TPA: hypothetical protein VGG72_35000 [Bryobacteraceae bacterium]